MDTGLMSALLTLVIAHIVVARSGGDDTESGYLSDMERLRRMLFRERDYDATSRPTNDSSMPTVVHVTLIFKTIKHVAIEDDWFRIALSLCAFWEDRRLMWEAQEYGDMTFIPVDASEVWSPDLDVSNARGEDFDNLKNLLTAQPDGLVWACSSVKVKAPCAVDMSGFPNDEQLCGIRVVSSAYSDSQVKLVEGLALGSHQDNASTEWNVTGISFVGHTALNRSFLDMSFRMRRFSGRHRHATTVPWVASALVMLAAFWIPVHSQHRITVAGLNFLFVILMLRRAAHLLGSSAVTPNILLFLGLATVVQVVSAAGHPFVLDLLSSTTRAEVPDAVHHVLNGATGTMLCLNDRELSEADPALPDDVRQLSVFDNNRERRRRWLLLAQALDRLMFLLIGFMTLAFLV